MAPAWHILTGEYPPQPGGVSDYTRQLVGALAKAGQEVHVWAPGDASEGLVDGVTEHRIPGLFTPSGLARLGRALDACRAPRRLLLQYVPHAFGLKAMNVPFCAWFAARREDERWVFFHEVVFPWNLRAPLRHHMLAGVTRVMARLVAGAADRVFVSIPAWKEHLPARSRDSAEWSPVPSNLPTEVPEAAVEAVRRELGPGPWLGHFSTYGALIAGPLENLVVPLLRANPERRALMLGRGSRAFVDGVRARYPALATPERLVARDALSNQDVAAHLRSCDVLLQPYPDGVSTRRTTVMAGLALGLPVVTHTGHLTENLWRELDAVALVEGASPEALVNASEQLLEVPGRRAALGERAARVYHERFSVERTVERMLRPTSSGSGLSS